MNLLIDNSHFIQRQNNIFPANEKLSQAKVKQSVPKHHEPQKRMIPKAPVGLSAVHETKHEREKPNKLFHIAICNANELNRKGQRL